MADLIQSIEEHKDLPEEKQKQAGKAIAGPMGDEHTEFVKKITQMIKDKKINAFEPDTILNKAVYDTLPPEAKGKVDQAKVNIADQLRHVADFYLSKTTPDSSPQLAIMIEHLWQMKDRIEKQYGDVFIF